MNIPLSVSLTLLANDLLLEGYVLHAGRAQHARAVAEELERNVLELRAALDEAQDVLDRLVPVSQRGAAHDVTALA